MYIISVVVLQKATPLLFLLFCFKLEKNLDNKFRDLLQE
jgi:hypothetical protein